MRNLRNLALAVICLAWTAQAQTVVNQGAPGKQGPWPVTVTGGVININLDGGFNSSVIQGAGQDGGAWNVSVNNQNPTWYPDGGFLGHVTTDTGSVVSVDNFPAGFISTQGPGQDGGAWNVSGAVSVLNFPSTWFPDGGALGTVIVTSQPPVVQGAGADGGSAWDVVGSVAVTSAPPAVQGAGADGGTAWDVAGVVSVSNFPSTWFPDGGFIGHVDVDNFPAVQAVSQSGAWTVGVSNFPAVQTVAQGAGIDGGAAWNIEGAVSVLNFPAAWFPDGGSLGTVAVENFPAVQTVSPVDGGVWQVAVVNAPLLSTVNQGVGQDGGAWNVSVNNLPAVQTVAQGVGIDGGPSWNVSGNVGVIGSPVVNAFGVNSTQVVATLGANATYTGAAYEPSTGTSIAQVRIFAFSDVASAADGLRLQTSSDSVTWQTIASRTVPAGVPVVMEVPYGSRYVRTVYVNGPVAQGVFKLVNSYQATSAQPVLAAIGSTPGASDLAATTNSLAYGSTGSGYVPLNVNDAGALSVNAAQSGAWTVGVSNFPSTWFPDGGALGTVAVSNFPASFGVTQLGGQDGGAWNVSVDNFPAVQAVSGTVASTQSGAWSVGINNFPAVQPVSGSVSVTNLPAVQTVAQGPSADGGAPWLVEVANMIPVYLPDASVTLSGAVAQGPGQDGGAWNVSGLVTTVPGNVLSIANSTNTPLGAGATWTGTAESVLNQTQISVFAFSDVSSVSNGLSIQFSTDGVNWDETQSRTLVGGTAVTLAVPAIALYYRVIYVNDGTAQGTFRLQTILNPIPTTGTISNISNVPVGTDQAVLTQSVITGITTGGGGGYRQVKVNPSGALTVAASQDTSPWIVSGTVTSTQGLGQDGGAWNVSVNNFPASWFPDGGALGSVSVSNFPASFGATQGAGADGGADWGVWVANFPATQAISGSVSVSNFPATQAVVQGNGIDGGSAWNVEGTVAVSNFPAAWFPDGGSLGTVTQGPGQDGGSWSASLQAPTFPADGGYVMAPNIAHTVGYQCGPTTAQTVATMNGFGPITVGAIENRIYTTVCNSKDNDTATIIRCRADGTSPILAAGSPGSVLGYGDCVTYPNPSAQIIQCIGPDATYVSVYECAPTDIVPPPSSGGSSSAF